MQAMPTSAQMGAAWAGALSWWTACFPLPTNTCTYPSPGEGGIGREGKCTHIVKLDEKRAVVADLAESACCAQRRDRDLASRTRGHTLVVEAEGEGEGNIGRQGQRKGGGDGGRTLASEASCAWSRHTREHARGGSEARTPARGRAARPRGARGSGGMPRAAARSPAPAHRTRAGPWRGKTKKSAKLFLARKRNHLQEMQPVGADVQDQSPWASASAHSFTHAMTPGGRILLPTPRARAHARALVSSSAPLSAAAPSCCVMSRRRVRTHGATRGAGATQWTQRPDTHCKWVPSIGGPAVDLAGRDALHRQVLRHSPATRTTPPAANRRTCRRAASQRRLSTPAQWAMRASQEKGAKNLSRGRGQQRGCGSGLE
jgi:hypothetical protein